MNIVNILRIQHTLAYEFLTSLFRLVNHEELVLSYKHDLEEVGFSPDEQLQSWVSETKQRFPKDVLSLAGKYFSLNAPFGMSLALLISALDLKDHRSFIKAVESTSGIEILKRFIIPPAPDTIEIDDRLVHSLIKNTEKALEFIEENMNISASHSWDLLQFMKKPQEMKDELLSLLGWYSDNIFDELAISLDDKIMAFEEEMFRNINRYGNDYFTLLVGFDYTRDEEIREITLSASYFMELKRLQLSLDDIGRDSYVIGYRRSQVIADTKHPVISTGRLLKILSDETRLMILKLLMGRDMYGQELARELGVANSNITHHLALLESAGLVRAYRIDHRTYYSFKRDSSRKLVYETLDRFFQ
ncbi:MAG TPA: metalloregulator ArsR/SmtB family transcription factor [Mesotoga sp.]|nr:metalloregulator ArsR/SmtB family transcription factor [Mesotoga sp.]